MTRKVFNYGGGMHSPTALTAFLRDALDGDVADGMVVSAGSGMNVTVGAGTARVGRDPSYDINITGTETVNVGAASPSNPMNSLIVAYVDRNVAGSTSVTDNTNDVFKLKAVDGVAATSPADPSTSTIQAAIGATNPYIVLARVRKRAGSTSILSTDITDMRNIVTLKAGRISAPNILANNLINSDHLANGIVLPRHLSSAALGDYSTSEVDTGRKWIDGRAIYQKTVTTGGLGNARLNRVPHNISNVDFFISINGVAKLDNSPLTINLPHAADQQAYAVTIYADANNINVQTYANQSGYTSSYVTLQYVKKR